METAFETRAAGHTGTALPSVDIVINNHNYGRFLSEAVESALAQTHGGVTVIVVDDGSTDGSQDLVRSFGDRIVPVLKPNGGQASAFEAGLVLSRGDVVVFLDADDLLAPDAAERVAEAFRDQPGLAKVHYRLAVIDEDGRPTGEIKPSPHIALPSGDLRTAELRFPFDLARPATSGNAFSTAALRSIRPIQDCGYRLGADWYVVHLTALYGPVAAIDSALGSYRVHGGNRHESSAETVDLDQVRATIGYTARTRVYLADAADRLDLRMRPDDASMAEVADRAISLKLDPAAHPIAGDSLGSLVRLGFRSARRRFDVAVPMRAAFACWLVCFAVAPRRFARPLADVFVFPGRRRALNGWLARMGRP
jgi:glycosyltransferase involved in cell wall biosynthesis